ncbi:MULTISPECIES: nitroreductase family protein [Staphylococcus]|uniref:nitroreductase family protein n=1 Tax=Staphylococcus TaxID=1279 RepID=UPI000660EE5D|nr:nitroreductase family protein [Staphylococcus hominis]OFM60226.1 NAD(P)H nitroreductase [Staphylococcus sp. HMSC062C01]OFM66099.1 NAD(P)H nitroreductase [Staphylococcus sp. HMSC068D07]OFR10003.1 NAD(P)H nitroreductase [Staphylococcus sp. HMSC078E07]GGO38471.1 NADH dehydrogenase [Plantactinospora veratri]KMU57213.1 NADH dehydrogenase [Staphylococcus hominis]
MNDFNEILESRKSVKGFDPNYKIPHEEMNEIISKATKAPSSVNMQPWRFVVVESDEAKAKLRPLIRFNTSQNDTSSAMIVIFGDLQCYEEGEFIYNKAVEEGHMPQEVKDQMLPFVMDTYKNSSREVMSDIVKVDSSLAAMQLMLVAKQYGYDTNPIGGFEHDKIGEAFGYDLERYVPVLIVAIGKKEKEPHTSYRMPVDKVVDYQ